MGDCKCCENAERAYKQATEYTANAVKDICKIFYELIESNDKHRVRLESLEQRLAELEGKK